MDFFFQNCSNLLQKKCSSGLEKHLKFEAEPAEGQEFAKQFEITKAELLQEGIVFLIHLFARAILFMKKLKITETKAT